MHQDIVKIRNFQLLLKTSFTLFLLIVYLCLPDYNANRYSRKELDSTMFMQKYNLDKKFQSFSADLSDACAYVCTFFSDCIRRYKKLRISWS